MNTDSLSDLFKTVLQHLKCIEVRIDYAKSLTSQNQKHVLNGAVNKVRNSIDNLCSLIPSDAALKVKKELDRTDLVYVMLLTEQLMQAINPEDYEEVVELLQNYIDKKYPK